MAGAKDWLEAEMGEVEEPVSSLRTRRSSSPPNVPADAETGKVKESASSLRPRSQRTRRSSPPPDVPADAETGKVKESASPLRPRSQRTRRSSPPADMPEASSSGTSSGSARKAEIGDLEKLVSSFRGSSWRQRPPSPPDAAAGTSSVGDGLGEEAQMDDLERLISLLRDRSTRGRLAPPPDVPTASNSVAGGSAVEEIGNEAIKKQTEAAEEEADTEEFSFPKFNEAPLPEMPAARNFSAGNEAAEKAAAGNDSVARNAAMKEMEKELLGKQKVLDVEGLERWLRRREAISELASFTAWCADEKKHVPPLEMFDSALRALDAVKSDELHHGASNRKAYWVETTPVPEFFVCPLTKKVMKDPVVLTSGKTVERSMVEKWLQEHKRICPVTGEVLTHTVFAPDLLTSRCIALWQSSNCIREEAAEPEPPLVTAEEQAQFDKASVLSHCPSTEQAFGAILLLRELVKKEHSSFRYQLGCNPGTTAKLVCILPETCLEPDPSLDDIILEIIANAAAYGPNKQIIGDDPYAIPVLIVRALVRPLGARVRCAQILGLLADTYCNKVKIGELGGIAVLVELLRVGDAEARKVAATVIGSLFNARENWSKFLKDEVADAAILAMQEDGLVDEACCIMTQLTGCQTAMIQVMMKLDESGDTGVLEKLMDKVWDEFAHLGHVNLHADLPASSAPEVVAEVVSWLQKRCYFPRTVRYKD